MSTAMLDDLTHGWGWLALRGGIAVLFGVLALIWPGITLGALVAVWGAFALLDGASALMAAFAVRDGGKPLWSLAVVGALGIAAGVLTFLWPGLTGFVLLLLMASWALVMGGFQIVAALRLRKEIEHEILLGLSGALSVAFGVLMFLFPGAGALALVWVIGVYAIAFGGLLLALAFRLRGYLERPLAGAHGRI